MAFTEDAYKRAVAWRDAALADGWISTATYGESEADGRASTLTRDGFKASVITRLPKPTSHHPNPKHEGEVSVWGPDRLAVEPGQTYDWEHIKAGLRHCGRCNADDVETTRVAFADRACLPCLPKAREKYEQPGWCN